MYVLEEVVMAQAGSLLAEMGAQMRHEQFWAMFNYTLALGLFSIAIVASVLATIAGATEDLRKRFGAGLQSWLLYQR